MFTATLIVNQPGHSTQEVESGASVMSIGSALDNVVCLEDDASVARYHAVIERHENTFRLSDLGTRQGTKVNDETVFLERELTDGDRITLGGQVVIEFYCHEASTPQPSSTLSNHSATSSAASELSYAVNSATSSGISSAATNISSSATRSAGATSVAAAAAATPSDTAHASADNPAERMSQTTKAALGIGGGLLLTATAAAFIFNPFGGDSCRASVRILTPPSGTILRSTASIRVEARDSGCIKRVSYQLDGEEVASASNAPYEATLDTRRLPRMSAGNHVLTATIETTDGAQARQSGEVYVAFNAASGESRSASPTPSPTDTVSESPVNNANVGSLTGTDVQAMSERLASQLTGKSGYVFERDMTNAVQTRTSDFSAAASLERAARQRRLIVKAFSDRGVRPLLGFVLAMSRSGFEETASREAGAGIWRLPHSVAQSYLQTGETLQAALDNPQRMAEISAVYLKDLLGVFEADNFDLAIACYGSTLEEAGALKQRIASLPAVERRNFWRLVERNLVSREQSERVIRFYAAGIVGENPQRFGAAEDRRLSALE